MQKQIAFLAQGNNAKFLGPVLHWALERHEVAVPPLGLDAGDEPLVRGVLERADLTWVEWVQDLAVLAASLPRRGRLVLRLHSFEAYTGLPALVDWSRVDALVVVAPHVAEIMKLRIPDLAERVRVAVVPNGVDLKRFALRKSKARTGRIAFVGALRHTKNLPMVLQCFAAAARRDQGLTLHLAGQYEGGELEQTELAVYLPHLIHALGLRERVVFHGQVADIPAFLEDKDALLSCSMRESFGYNIAEAMARGVAPVVHHFPGAEELFPGERIFHTVDEAAELLLAPPPPPHALRAFVAERHSLAHQRAALEALIGELLGP
ncbi:MAG: glycosyltransferase [Proteobacteria bacterium]|nr:glycosyltransferase [Pseudomonadota bacterium]MBU1595847.1 glycosyltransferase [Pseudomonadota bacterium]